MPVSLGRTLATQLDVFVCIGTSSGPVALVVAGIHGDEYEGPAAVAQFASEISVELVSGIVLLVPVAHPTAFEAGTRTSPIDRLNLARVFPGKADGRPTERLAHFLFSEFALAADYLIDLHSGGVDYQFLPLAGFYGHPERRNPSWEAALMMGLPALWQLPETDGVLSREFTRLGKTAVGAEYLGGGSLADQGIREYVQGIWSCLTYWGVCKGPMTKPSREATILGNDWLPAPASGLFHACCKLGDLVRGGERLATIRDRRGSLLAEVVAEENGLVLGLRNKAYIQEKEQAVLVGTMLTLKE